MEHIQNQQENQSNNEETNIVAVVIFFSITAVMLFAIAYAFVS